jgi:hypothetical protein
MKTVLMILSPIPVLIDAIKAIEAAIPGSGNGEKKLAMVREVMETADDTADEVIKLWPTIEKIIAVIVKTLKATGIFK